MTGMNPEAMGRYNVVRLTLFSNEEGAEDGATNRRGATGAATTTAKPETMSRLEFSTAVLQRDPAPVPTPIQIPVSSTSPSTRPPDELRRRNQIFTQSEQATGEYYH